MSRMKVRNLFSQARKIRLRTHQLDLRWLRTHSACLGELTRIETESLKMQKELNRAIAKLERAGFGMSEIYARTRTRR